MIPAPSDPAPTGASAAWHDLHRGMLACTRCVESGHISFAQPLFQGAPGQRLVLVGQAPGARELGPRKPFAGRSGAELARWMTRAGFDSDDHFRSLTYITSITKCFPGRALSGGGDRRPSGVEVAQCRPWLDGQLELVRPRLLLLVGSLAHAAFPVTRGRGLDRLIGRAIDGAGLERGAELGSGRPFPEDAPEPWCVPLPHPSGASRWLNLPAHRVLLERALGLIALLWPVLAAEPTYKLHLP